MSERNLARLVCAAIAVATALAYWPVLDAGWVWDDIAFVTRNPHVQQGLTPSSIAWAFTSKTAANWHPITMLSHMLDVELFALSASAHHAMNVALHIVSAWILLHALGAAGAALWPSALVTAVFALHPIHVESVAWVAERKEILGALFAFAAIRAHAQAVGGERSHAWTALWMACSLMSKPTWVTLPFVLLLVDVWPLGRLGTRAAPRALASCASEKALLFALSFATIIGTLIAQRGALAGLDGLPLAPRLANAVTSYARYVELFFWPSPLGVFYEPRPEIAPALVTLALLATATGALAWWARREIAPLVGWLWFGGTLVPMIGIVQVGGQGMADRYAHVPSVGLSIVVIWGIVSLAQRNGFDGAWARRAAALAAAIWLAVLGAMSHAQSRHWHDELTLWTHAAHAAPNAVLARRNAGIALQRAERHEEALTQLLAALELRADDSDAAIYAATSLRALGRSDDAVALLRRALEFSDDSYLYVNLGHVWRERGALEAAREQFEAGFARDPKRVDFCLYTAQTLADLARWDDAIARHRACAALDPASTIAREQLEAILSDHTQRRP